jgi:multidrug efflux pump subunit AcrA (membrane-fusion protein)
VRFVELPKETLSAVVVRRAQSISSDGGGMRVELSLPNPQGRIPAGMVGEVGLSLPRIAQAVLVPISAVVNDARGARVARVSDDAALDIRRVTVGRNLGSDIEILDGIEAGDQVVTSPNALIESGSKVSVTRADLTP